MNPAAWSESIGGDLQPTIDHAFTEGLNRIYWHEFTSSPASDGLPGQEYFAGTHLNPNVTWWKQAGPFLLALNRTQFLLQQGRPVSDLLYFYGDQVPGFARLRDDDPAHLGSGYDYDVVNEDALLHRIGSDGSGLRTPEGVHDRAVALPLRVIFPGSLSSGSAALCMREATSSGHNQSVHQGSFPWTLHWNAPASPMNYGPVAIEAK